MEKGARVSAKDDSGETALMKACSPAARSLWSNSPGSPNQVGKSCLGGRSVPGTICSILYSVIFKLFLAGKTLLHSVAFDNRKLILEYIFGRLDASQIFRMSPVRAEVRCYISGSNFADHTIHCARQAMPFPQVVRRAYIGIL